MRFLTHLSTVIYTSTGDDAIAVAAAAVETRSEEFHLHHLPLRSVRGLVNNSKKNVEGPKNKKTKIIITNERRGNFR